MVFFPNAKINLGLHITDRRKDGYHNIETLILPVDLCDIAEFIPSQETTLVSTGINIDTPPAQNLILKAYQVIALKHGISPLQIILHKIIPPGSGLGGGSSDAAFMLKKLNEYFNLNISAAELSGLSAKLGSDCPFFIHNKAAYVTGRGDKLELYPAGLEKFRVAIVHPPVIISTSHAYSLCTPCSNRPTLKSLLVANKPENWKNIIKNDFEQPVFGQYPEIAKIKKLLYDSGALYASMTGSGSAVYGLFNNEISLTSGDFPGCFFWKGRFIQ